MEIGSEFWLDFIPDSLFAKRDGVYPLSGRTAIDIILQDILKKRSVSKAYLPAYCCESMISPFIKRGIRVELYDICFDGKLNYIIDENNTTDIFYVTNYFGYNNNVDAKIIEKFIQKGSIIIYDNTHSLLKTNDHTELLSDYSFGSIRKWLGVIGGAVVYKKNGEIDVTLSDCPYLKERMTAMQEKAKYIKGDEGILKDTFLDNYAIFNNNLEKDYQNYRMDDLSYTIWKTINIEKIRTVRFNNAKILHDNIDISFMGSLETDIYPIFVPILLQSKEQRNSLKEQLIKEKIYCPVHWPKNSLISPNMKVNNIFDTELSLICDQRYNENDMNKIVKIVNKALN